MADVRYCPWCGAEVVDEGAEFCGACGRPLDADGPVTEQPSGPRHPRARKATVITAVSAVVIVLALGSIAWMLAGGGAAPQDGGGAPADEAANASAGADASEDGPAPSADAAAATTATAGDVQESTAASAPAQSDHDRVIASLNGWWTQVGNRPYNYYVYYRDGMAYNYSHEGELRGSGALDVSVERVGPPDFGESGWKISSNADDPSRFDVLNDAGDMLWYYWYDDAGKPQLSGSDSIRRCGDGYQDPLPSFAAQVEAGAGSTSQAATTSSGSAFEAQMPTITGWTQQPLPYGASGFIWRASWNPIEGAEGYEVSRWDLDTGEWVHQTQTVTDTWYDCAASASEIFAVQVRGYRTEGGQRVYTQWSARSEKRTS